MKDSELESRITALQNVLLVNTFRVFIKVIRKEIFYHYVSFCFCLGNRFSSFVIVFLLFSFCDQTEFRESHQSGGGCVLNFESKSRI